MMKAIADKVPETLPSTFDEFIATFNRDFTKLPIDEDTFTALQVLPWFDEKEVADHIFDPKDDGTPFSWACAAITDGGRKPSFKNREVGDSMHGSVDAVLVWLEYVSDRGTMCRNKRVKRTPGRPKTGARPDVALSIDENRLHDICRGEEKVMASYRKGDPAKDPEVQLLESYPPAFHWEGTYGKETPYAFGFTVMGSGDQLLMDVGLIMPKAEAHRKPHEESLEFKSLDKFDLNKEIERLKAFVYTLNLYPYMVEWERNIPDFAIPDIGGLKPREKDLFFDYEEGGVFEHDSVPCTLHFRYDRVRHELVKVFKISAADITDEKFKRLTDHFERISAVLATIEREFVTHITVSVKATPTPTSAAASSSTDLASDHRITEVFVSPPCYQTANCIPTEAKSILDAVEHTLEALAQVHAKRLLHRDVRWPNIGFCQGRWLLFDWDEAAPMGKHVGQPTERFGEMAAFPRIIRLPGYRDHHVDIYAVMALLLDETAKDIVRKEYNRDAWHAIETFCYEVSELSTVELNKGDRDRTMDNTTFTTADVLDAFRMLRESMVVRTVSGLVVQLKGKVQ